MIGQTLAGRYEILDRIGGGGMALVYKARDILLNRIVAVKVLRSQFVNDEEFIQRFRREAQSAAALSHPNVVSIYDVGQREDIHYIVMEYVEGKTLNDLIKERAPLQVEEAVNIAAQICDALDHAHSNQIIHRDIKPHNILLGRNGRVKVTDFGIARAGASSSITQTGSVVGSVHYFSPEHAKGTKAGAKSDLYSLGIVIYQMLTATLPFSGESPVSVALKHLQENVEDPRKINPLIPQSVENAILKAMRKNPDSRYRSAKEMLEDLETCLRPERRNEPKLMFTDIDEDDAERTRVVPAIRDDSYLSRRSGNQAKLAASSKRKWIKPAIWGCVFILIVVGLLFAAQIVKRMAASPEDIIIPNVKSQEAAAAEKTLRDAGFEVKLEHRHDIVVAKGLIIDQSPVGGTVKVKPEFITLTVSDGPGAITMIDYTGKSITEAMKSLKDQGMTEDQILIDTEPSDQPKDAILDQIPLPGETIDPKVDTVSFTIAEEQAQVSMPNLIGKKLELAKSMLTVRRLSVSNDNIIYHSSFEQPEGLIYKQFPYNPDDEVDPGAENIVLYVSTGRPKDVYDAVFSLPSISPAKAGESSTILIQVTDVQSDKQVVVNEQISEAKSFAVPVVVTKSQPAKVQVLRDNTLFETYTFTYEMYLNTINKPSPTATPTPTVVNSPDGASPSPETSASGNGSAEPVTGTTETPAQQGG
ncbi:MAG: Stk1 family PASTA domain-containing Ser/Thr kinase [Gorillibacterium sp.]|nr:Stk1 family PASTA domain-containing Ser/Thr kinase [Gorillibacterium sp.]